MKAYIENVGFYLKDNGESLEVYSLGQKYKTEQQQQKLLLEIVTIA